MNCRYSHGMGLPCPACMKLQIPILQKENEDRIKQGRTDLHDIENIRRVIDARMEK